MVVGTGGTGMVHGTFGSWFIMVHGSSTSEATESSAGLRVNGSRLIKQKPGKPLQWALRSCRAFMPSVTQGTTELRNHGITELRNYGYDAGGTLFTKIIF